MAEVQQDKVKAVIDDWRKKRTDFDWVCAVDFGSSATGLAFQNKAGKDVITCEWGTAIKTDTAILFNEQDQVVSFGSEAIFKYSSLKTQATDLMFFSNFKMELYSGVDSPIQRNLQFQSKDGRQKPARDVIAAMLSYLKQLFTKRATTVYGLPPNHDRVLWAITVPAIWHTTAKQLIRKSAEQAGLCDVSNHRKLLLVHEPEAAAVKCLLLNSEEVGFGNVPLQAPFGGEDRVLVIDLGGGTVDITVLEIISKNQFHVCYKASGGPWGSSLIEHGILQVIREMAGEFFEEWSTENPDDFVELTESIKKQKELWNGDSTTGCVIRLSLSFILMMKTKNRNASLLVKQTSKKIEQRLPQQYRTKDEEELVDMKREDRLTLHGLLLKHLFEQCTGNISEHLERMVEEGKLHNVRTAYAVGGFARNRLVQQEISRVLVEKAAVNSFLVPNQPSATVLLGAVRLGWELSNNNDVLVSRVADRTYGIECALRFDEKRHGSRPSYEDHGVRRTAGCFYTFIKKDDKVCVGTFKKTRMSFTEEQLRQGSASTKIYSSSRQQVEFCDEPGCRLEAKFKCTFPPSQATGVKRYVTHAFLFEGSELQVLSVNEDTNTLYNTTVDFLEKL